MSRIFRRTREQGTESEREQTLQSQKGIRDTVVATEPFERYGERTIEGQGNLPGRVQQKLPSRDVQPNTPEAPKWSGFHNDVNADTNVYNYPVSWKPKYWFFVGRLSAGYIRCHIGAGKAAYHVRIDKGTVMIHSGADVVSIETVGATGWYSVYPVNDLETFDVIA